MRTECKNSKFQHPKPGKFQAPITKACWHVIGGPAPTILRIIPVHAWAEMLSGDWNIGSFLAVGCWNLDVLKKAAFPSNLGQNAPGIE
jgi:hypothetical protein